MSKFYIGTPRRLLSAAVVLAAVGVAPRPGVQTALAQEFNLRIAHHYPDTHLQAKGYKQFADEVAKNSGGRIKIRTYPAETLVSTRETFDAVRSGTVEAAPMTSVFHVGQLPDLDALHLPFLFDDANHFRRTLRAGLVDTVAAMYLKNGIRVVNYFHKGATHIYDKGRFLVTPADFKGRKIRSLGGALSEMLVALGANSVTLPTGEINAALERGVIDGMMTNCAAHIARGWVDHLKYVTYMDFAQTAEGVGINEAFYQKLPADLKAVVMDAAKRMEETEWSSMIEDDNVSCFDKWKARGAKVQKLTPEQRRNVQAMIKPVYDKYAAKIPLVATVFDLAAKNR